LPLYIVMINVCISGVVPGMCFPEFSLDVFVGSIEVDVAVCVVVQMCGRLPTLIVQEVGDIFRSIPV